MFSEGFIKTMDVIVSALQEKGYNPYKQLYAYITENEPEYITRHKDARRLIMTLDKNHVWQYMKIRWL